MNLTIGSTTGDYQIVGILGAGGMGQVYKVRNVISDRIEAMKILLPDLANQPELADRFLREIKVQAGLDHPNIAQLRTALRVDNQLLMLMEFVEGESLDRRLARGPLPAAEAVDYIIQVLSALEYAHAHGLVHRDVKPANMIVTEAGVLKLMDFGIAKVTSDHSLTMTGTTLGSLYYMSPEQIQGAANLDGRSDLYSVGVALYELVTGKRPFDGESQFSIMQAHLASSPAPPIQIDPKLPAMLNDVILLSVRKDAGERFQSAAAFRNALGAVAAELKGTSVPAVAAPPASGPAPQPAAKQPASVRVIEPAQPKPSGKRRGLWIAVGGLAAVLAIVAVIQFGPRRAANAGREAVPVPASAPTASAPAAVPETLPPAQAQPQSQPEPQQQAQPAPPVAAAKAPTPKRAPAPSPAAAPAFTPPNSPAQAPAQAPVQAVRTPAQPPAPSGPSPAEIQQAREHIAMLSVRSVGIRSSLQSMQRSQAAAGLNLRGDMQEAATLMTTYMDGASAALNAGDIQQARSFADKAERQAEKLEKFLNR